MRVPQPPSAAVHGLIRAHVDTPPLDKVARKPRACRIGVECPVRELFVEETKQTTEGRFVPAVWGRGQQN